MLIILYHIILFATLGSTSSVDPLQEEKIYTVSEVSVKPEPVMGLKAFREKWSKMVKYPEDAIKKQVQGIVFIEFVVRSDSSVVDAAVKQGIGFGCDEAALKGFEELSKEGWKPGVKLGQPVKVKMVLPFYFRIIQQ
ncbi:MAG: energy transducer TonB [Cyclobacteriaceae bacterium]